MKLKTREALDSFGHLSTLLLFLTAATIVAVGYAAQAATFLNHDVGWVLYSTGMLLRGAVYGRDIIEPNPPLIWWISSGPAYIAQQFALPVWTVYRLFVVVLVLLCLFVSDRFLVAGRATRATRAAFLITAAYLFTISPSRDFGQREHLAVMLVLPYLFAVAQRMNGKEIGSGCGAAIGAAAGLALALKPYFIGVPVLLEVILLLRTRSFRLLLRPEAIGATLAIAVYAAAVIVFARPWLASAAPDILRVYWAFEVPASGQFLPLLKRFVLAIIGVCIVVKMKTNDFAYVLIAASIGFALAAILQGKYYTYHIYPIYSLLALALVVSFGSLPRKWRLPMVAILLGMFVQDTILSTRTLMTRSSRGAIGQEYASMVGFVEANTPRDGAFLAVSTHPYPGFPTALYAGRRWASTSNSQIFMPAVVRLREQGPQPDSELQSFAERKAREAINRDLAGKPELVLIDQRSNRHAIGQSRFDYLKFFMEDPAFRSSWSNYVPAPHSPRGFAAFVRKKD